jgi:surfactin synthase thioesterase subunit
LLLLVGEDDVHPHAASDGKWSRYISEPQIHVVPGGYHFIVDSAREVRAVLADIAPPS